MFGDVTNDCVLNIADAAYCRSYVRVGGLGGRFGSLAPEQLKRMDVNHDGEYSVHDCMYMHDVFLGKIVITPLLLFSAGE